jgi:hypothetical protein
LASGIFAVVTMDDDRHVGHDAGVSYARDIAGAAPKFERELKFLTGPLEVLWRASCRDGTGLRKAG